MNGEVAYRIGRFLISGGTATALNFGVLYVFTEFFHVWYLASSIAGVSAGFVASFLLQKFWTFRSTRTDIMHIQLLFYMVLFLLNLGLNACFMYLLVEYIHLWYMFAQFLISAGLACINYSLYRRWIFSPSPTSIGEGVLRSFSEAGRDRGNSS